MTDERRGASSHRARGAAPLHMEADGSTSAPLHARRAAGRADRRGRSIVELDVPGGAAVPWILGAAGILLLVAVIVLLLDMGVWGGRIHPGVHVSGIDVGGLAPAEATTKLTTQLGPRYKLPVDVKFEAKDWKVQPASLGATPNPAASVHDALDYGRKGSWFGDAFVRLAAYFVPADLPASSTVDPAKFEAAMDEFATAARVRTVDAGVAINGTDVSVKPAKPGRELDRSKAEAEVLAALSQAGPRQVTLTASQREAGVQEDSARAAADAAKLLMAGPATVVYQAKKWDLTPETIAKTITFRVVPQGKQTDPNSLVPVAVASDPPTDSVEATGPVALGARIDPDALGRELGPRIGGLGRPAIDARFDTSGGHVTIVPHQVGLGPDLRSLARDLTGDLKSPDATKRVATLTLGQTLPELTTEKARTMGIVERISTFSTDFDSSNQPRVNNIETLGKAIDGSLIPPGGVWSLNGRVGERTAAKGYQEANAIVNGRLVPQLGGGICQVATTVFNAIFFSGEPVVERSNHSFYISHYPKGRDATVNWGGPDLKFKNDTKTWILIKTAADSSSITVSLYGTSPGYQVSYTTGPLVQTSSYPTDKQDDPSMPVGAQVVSDSGEPGYKISVTRVVSRGGAVVRKDVFMSDYKPKTEIVRVGTKAVPAPTPPKPSKPSKPTSGTGN